MKDGGGGGGRQQWPCDYCGEAAAALHCRTDAARLCVAAGGGEPAFLCADCDGGCDGTARLPVEGFFGCPTVAELAASWGLDLPSGSGGGEDDEEDAFLSALDYSMLAVNPDLRDLCVPCES